MSIDISAAQTSRSGDAIIATTYGDNAVFLGGAYTLETVIENVSNGTTTNVVFDPTAYSNGRVVVYPTRWATSAGSIVITLGTVASYTGGTETLGTNQNYACGAPRVVTTIGATLTGFTASNTKLLVGLESKGSNKGGGSSAGGDVSILDPSLIYAFQFTNGTGSAFDVSFFLKWVEQPARVEWGF